MRERANYLLPDSIVGLVDVADLDPAVLGLVLAQEADSVIIHSFLDKIKLLLYQNDDI